MTAKTKKLFEILAIQKGVKSRNTSESDKICATLKKEDLFKGHVRKFQALQDESNEKYPDDTKRVQHKVLSLLEELAAYTTEIIDSEATADASNAQAFSDIVLEDGTVLVTNVPVTTLLDLEKIITDWRTTVQTLPTLDPSENWTFADGQYKSDPIVTHKTSKIEEPLIIVPSTKEHPAQAKTITRDVITGHWHATKFSTCIKSETKTEMWKRANRLLDAVKTARERANSRDAVELKIGEKLFNYLKGE